MWENCSDYEYEKMNRDMHDRIMSERVEYREQRNAAEAKLAYILQERDTRRAELAAAKNEIDQVTSLHDECHEKFIAAEGEIARLNGECQRLDHDRDALAADNERLRKACKALREEVSAGCAEDAPVEELKPGIDFEVVLEVDAVLAATPAQSLAAHDAAAKEPSAFLPRAAWRVVKEVWIDVSAGRMNARSAIADAALDLRGLLEESGPEPPDEAVGVKRKAETTFGGYLAAHDAALLREVANKFEATEIETETREPSESYDCGYKDGQYSAVNWLLSEAGRIEKEAAK